MTYLIAALILVFIAGFLVGRGGRLYFYLNGELRGNIGADRYIIWDRGVGSFGVELFGVDYTDGVLAPVYRPTIRAIRSKHVRLIGLRIGDFSEVSMLMSSRWPLIQFRYQKDVHDTRSIDE